MESRVTALSWGDQVRVHPWMPQEFHPDQAGAVVGFRRIESNGPSISLVFVEFSDGTAIEIPDFGLELVERGTREP
jgi:hypothetical protein